MSQTVTVRILGLTRSVKSEAAQALAALSGVEMEEYDWVNIDADWLKARNVVKAFIASHNGASQFTDESGFLLAALQGRPHLDQPELHRGVQRLLRTNSRCH